MKRLILVLAVIGTPALPETDLCANARLNEKSFLALLEGLRAVNLICGDKRSDECLVADAAIKAYNETSNGMGSLAANWTRIQACQD